MIPRPKFSTDLPGRRHGRPSAAAPMAPSPIAPSTTLPSKTVPSTTVPAWLRRAAQNAETPEDAAVAAGAALGGLDAVVRRHERWAGALSGRTSAIGLYATSFT
jgi:hypothetical protein